MITITFLSEESAAPPAEEAAVEIVLKRLNEDGTTDELQLEGDLSDARALALTLEAGGSCVEVEIGWPEEESAEEGPGTNEETPGEPGTSEEISGSGEKSEEIPGLPSR